MMKKMKMKMMRDFALIFLGVSIIFAGISALVIYTDDDKSSQSNFPEECGIIEYRSANNTDIYFRKYADGLVLQIDADTNKILTAVWSR